MKSVLLLATAGLCAAPSFAQSVSVFPSDHDPSSVAQGSSFSSRYPFSFGRSRVMFVMESWDLGIPAGQPITRIGFRGDTFTSPSAMLQLEVLMGPTDKTAADAESTFANNYGGATTTVFNPQVFQLPPMPNANNDEVWIDLDTPYVPDPNRNLLIEFRVLANSNGSVSFNYYLDRATVHSPETSGLAGCPGSSGRVPTLSQNDIEVGGSWRVTLSGAPGSSLSALAIDVGGGLLPTPVPLRAIIGGASSQCLVGIPTTGTSEILSAVADGSGTARWTNTIPANRAGWLRAPISIQAVSLDFFAPGGVTVSNALRRDVGIRPAMTLIAAQGDPATVSSGGLNRNYGLVTLFEHQ